MCHRDTLNKRSKTMLFVIIIIICFIMIRIGYKRYNDTMMKISIIIACLSGTFLLMFAFKTKVFFDDYKEKQLKIIEEWKMSNKIASDWTRLTSEMQKTNEIINSNFKDIWIMYIVDVTYPFRNIDEDDYLVKISENKISFPEEYDMEPLENPLYRETEIDGIKYRLVPIE